MMRSVAFLRGINVGGHRVKMERLRALFADLGFSNVTTFIASGNVIFEASAADADALAGRIEAHLEAALGFEVKTFLRTPADLASVLAFRPFAPGDAEAPGHTMHVAFLRDPLAAEAGRKLLSYRTAMDDFRVHGRELYWLCRCKITESLVNWRVVEKTLAQPSTMRNVTMLRKLAAAHPPG